MSTSTMLSTKRLWRRGGSFIFAVLMTILISSNIVPHVISFPFISRKNQPQLLQGYIHFDPFLQHQPTALASSSDSWLPFELIPEIQGVEDDSGNSEVWVEEVELKAVELATHLARKQLERNGGAAKGEIPSMIRGNFVDLCCTKEGELTMERIFIDESVTAAEPSVILGAVACFHSVLVMGMSYGMSGTPEQFGRWTAHLKEPKDDDVTSYCDYGNWTIDSTRRLKLRNERSAGTNLLSLLMRKQSPQGAFDFLVALGVWRKHEDLALLRSGFPLRFCSEEFEAAEKLLDSSGNKDPDALLGIRKDMRDMKIFTIDSASTSEIDDAVACEIFTDEFGNKKLRYWIHIADADHMAPRNSKSFDGARRRATSHYLPQAAISMFPPDLSNAMSLTTQRDSFALSMGVELNDDGSVMESSIIVTPSIVQVSYRLTYDEVDEMLEDGVGYREEWELGALFDAATRRRNHRIQNGSAESFIPQQVPQYSISAYNDKREPDGIGISISVDVSHNGGVNQSSVLLETSSSQHNMESPLSSASLLVTEMMILAGEAIGKWKQYTDSQKSQEGNSNANRVKLAFRSQSQPDYRSRGREKRIMEDLLANNIGDGYCHAWYARRFLNPVQVFETARPHSGLGLDCYCQWTSPIRRFGDLQVHCAIKRFLRRQAATEALAKGNALHPDITAHDLGLGEGRDIDGLDHVLSSSDILDSDIDYSDRAAWIRAARMMQKNSQKYWMLEYILRLKKADPDKKLDVLVLGCTNPERRQYALYVYELGLEWRYVSPVSSLQAGMKFKVKIGNVLPRLGQLTFVQDGV